MDEKETVGLFDLPEPMSEREMDEMLEKENPAKKPEADAPPEKKETDESPDGGEPAVPEDFRPVVPEPEVRRRTAYYFRRDYPETESPTSTHTLTFAQLERRRKWRSRVLYALLLLAVFALAFVITAVCLMISNQPIG